MKLGLAIEYAGKRLDVPIDKFRLAEELGFDSLWSAEAYGSDALTPLAFIAAHTKRIRLGTGIIQVGARTPTATAMAVATLDALAGGGRAIAGLGLSGPQIVEGWYGVPWGSPYHKLRDTVAIMRAVFEREAPVQHAGKAFALPYAGDDASGMGKPLKLILHTNPDIPIFLGTGERTNVILTAQVANGWLPFGFRAQTGVEPYREWIQEGFRRAGGGKSWKDFEIQAGCAVEITDDVQAALAARKPFVALYVGGMGHPELNFHKRRMEREGWPEAAGRIQELFLAGKREEAIAAVPDEYLDEGGLIGSPERIRERYRAHWEKCGATGLTLHNATPEAMELMAELAGTRDR